VIPSYSQPYLFVRSPEGSGRPGPTRMLALVVTAALVLGAFLIGGSSGTARAATTVRVMPLGDSITGSPGCWRQLLWSRLQSTGYTGVDFVGTLNNSTSCGTAYDGDNEGHGGFQATGILNNNQLPGWLSSSKPDVVMMQLATNDVWSNISTSSILTTFGGLVDQMRANNPSMRVVVAQILPMNPSGCSECAQRVINLNAAIPAWAASKSTAASPITVVDLWTGFNTATDTGDGVHPNDAGNQKIASAWYPALTAAVNSVGTTGPTTGATTPPASTTPTPAPTATFQGGCLATFNVTSSWTGGFVGTVKVSAPESAISRWKVNLTMPSGTSITNIWNATLAGSTASSLAWNSSVASGQSVEFGFQGAGSVAGVGVASCTAG
jgi:lysophospholipase L1-like esterase